MLDFCAERFKEKEERLGTAWDRDTGVYLEAFLLHYRNLIRFFSGKPGRPGDLSTRNSIIWGGRELNAAEIANIKEPAEALDSKWHAIISKYLQHLTKIRSDLDRCWDLPAMHKEITPVIAAFKQAFPSKVPA